jgi:hypothetical protein
MCALTALLTLSLAGCGSSKDAGAADQADSGPHRDNPDSGSGDGVSDDTGPEAGDPGVLALPAGEAVSEGHFSTGQACAECHANSDGSDAMRDSSRRPIAPYDLWQSTAMANSSRDPLWRAVVSAEVAATPSQSEAIEARCARCHMPMGSADAALHGDDPVGLDLLTEDSERGQLALDGVSCTACHQIEDEGLGEEVSFSGSYTIEGRGKIYGPHDDLHAQPMEMHSGFTPTYAEHVPSAGHCATCHTLFTDALDADGAALGASLPEQTPYLEWLNSAYADSGPDCAGCHAPTGDEDGRTIETAIAHNPHGSDWPTSRVPERSPYGRHIFVGGNTLLPALLRDNADLLNSPASSEAFDETIRMAREQLSERTGTLSIASTARDGASLAVTLEVGNLAGHKLPTGFPARRAWVQLVVRDAAGAEVFASGSWDTAGRILGPSGVLESERAGGPLQGHHQRITSGDQVQIYQAIMLDPDGAPTWTLLRGVDYAVDNRLLPLGWDAGAASADIAPRGVDDADFGAGGDAVSYEVSLGDSEGPWTIEAALVYQPLGARFAAELFTADTPEVRGFQALYEAAKRGPEWIATETAEVP